MIGLVIAAITGLAVLFLAGANRRQVQRLPDGSTLRLTNAKLAATNYFLHGTRLEKLIGPILPTKGIHLGKLRLSAPEKVTLTEYGATTLTVEFRLDPGSASTLDSSLFDGLWRQGSTSSWQSGKSRWVIRGNDNIPYVCSVAMPPFGQWRDGSFTYLNTGLFPRRSRQLLITLESREHEGADWHEAARFTLRNPAVARVPSWTAASIPNTKRVGEMEFCLGEVGFQMEPLNTNNIWPSTVRVPFRVTRRGVVQTNWSADKAVFEDASGNAHKGGWAGPKVVKNGWLLFETIRSPDPDLVWRITVDFGLDSGWLVTNICTMQIPSRGTVARTNFNGVPIEVGRPSRDALSVSAKLPAAPNDLRLRFLDVSDQTGRSRRADIGAGDYTRDRFQWLFRSAIAGGTVTFALDTSYHVEFYTKAKWFTNNQQ